MKKICTYLSWSLVALFFWNGCAQELSPTGGEREKIPPSVVKTNPPNETLNVRKGEVKFFFSEAVRKPDPSKDIFISPFVSRPKVVLSDNGRKVTIKIEGDLLDSTTYVITLNGIRDVNEGNQIAEPYILAFSTGNQLDSMELQGKILDPSGKPVKDMLALLYISDSVLGNNILRKRPTYLSRSDEQGAFSFKFLKAGNYRVFGVTDTDGSNSYSQPNEVVAITADSVIMLTGDSSDAAVLALTSFVVDETAPSLRRFFWTNGSTLAVQLSEAIRLSSLKLFATDTLRSDTTDILVTAYVPGTEKEVWVHFPAGPSWMDLHFVGLADSMGNTADTILRIRPDRRRDWKSPIEVKPRLKLELPAVEFLPGRHITDEDRQWFALTDTSSFDSIRQTFTIEWQPDGIWQRITPLEKEATGIPLMLRVDGTFFYGADSTAADTVFTYPVPWLQLDAYGTLTGTLIPDSTWEGPLVIHMLGPDNATVARTITDTIFSFQNLLPGEYSFRVLYDEDGNGIPSTGSLRKQRLPERTKLLPEKITIRANWDFEDHIVDLNQQAPPPAPPVTEGEAGKQEGPTSLNRRPGTGP